jgi:hypothetical protein
MIFRRKKESFDDKIVKAIPATIQILSLTPDTQLPRDANAVGDEVLPQSYGKDGGANSSALLDTLRQHPVLTYKQMFQGVRQNLETYHNSTQRPVLLASRKFLVDDPFYLIPSTHHGKKYALLISVSYNGMLPKADKAVLAWSDYLVRHEKFSPNLITVLSDTPSETGKGTRLPPTHGNILNAFRHIVQTAREGDVVVIQFVGHCSLIKPKSTRPAVFFPSDYAVQPNNPITLDDLTRTLIVPLRAGVHMTIILDTCHGAGANAIPLPYSYTLPKSRVERDEMVREVTFEILGGVGALVLLGTVAAATDASDCCDASLCHALLDCGPHCC